MIEYNIKIQGSKVIDNFKHIDTSMSEISILVFSLNKKINELCELESPDEFSIKYPIDEDGNLIKEGEEE